VNAIQSICCDGAVRVWPKTDVAQGRPKFIRRLNHIRTSVPLIEKVHGVSDVT